MFNLKDKVVIVTGGTGGIGRKICEDFLINGSTVISTYNKNSKIAKKILKEFSEKYPNKISFFKLDIKNRKNVNNLFNKIKNTHKKIDVLINNSGVNKVEEFEKTTNESWDFVIDTNLKGTFISCQEIFKIFKKQQFGRIINISSASAMYHGPKTVHYAVSKAGINSLTKIVARYGAKYNILVNAIAPGIVKTNLTKKEISGSGGDNYLKMTLLKSFGRLEDVSSFCIYLSSDNQKHVTGQVFNVSGGAVL